jgi:hypothetical protein
MSNYESEDWGSGQIATFAADFARSAEGRAWWAFVDDVREAIIDSVVLKIVLSGRNENTISLGAIRSLRRRFAQRLQAKHGLRNQAGES